jgi:hypothetical protein
MSRRHEITLTQLRYFATAAERRSETAAAYANQAFVKPTIAN